MASTMASGSAPETNDISKAFPHILREKSTITSDILDQKASRAQAHKRIDDGDKSCDSDKCPVLLQAEGTGDQNKISRSHGNAHAVAQKHPCRVARQHAVAAPGDEIFGVTNHSWTREQGD